MALGPAYTGKSTTRHYGVNAEKQLLPLLFTILEAEPQGTRVTRQSLVTRMRATSRSQARAWERGLRGSCLGLRRRQHSIRGVLFPDHHHRLEQYLQIQPQRPAPNVLMVPVDPLFHFVDRFGLSTASIDLR